MKSVSIWHLIVTTVALVIFLNLYFMPTTVAWKRKIARDFGTIFFINIFAGWTIVGWLILLVWAAAAQKRAQPVLN